MTDSQKTTAETEAMRDTLIVFGTKSEAYYLSLSKQDVASEYDRMMAKGEQ